MAVAALGFVEGVNAFDLKAGYRLTTFLAPDKFQPGAPPGRITGAPLDAVKAKRKGGMSEVPRGAPPRFATYREDVAAAESDEEKHNAVDRGIVAEVSRGVPLDHSPDARARTGRPGGTQSNPYQAERLHLMGIQLVILFYAAGYRVEPRDLPRALEIITEDQDRRAWQRLQRIGRRAYALELVERDRQRPQSYARPIIVRKTVPATNAMPARSTIRTVPREGWDFGKLSSFGGTSPWLEQQDPNLTGHLPRQADKKSAESFRRQRARQDGGNNSFEPQEETAQL
jgi:hypothetical protein